MELWLKRYLSLFFDFKYFGILNLLLIPLLIYFFITIKKRKRWERALVFVFILSCFSLEIRGGFWSRYILTLYPFTIAAIFLLGWEFIKKKNRYLQIGVFVICGIFIFFNYYNSRDIFKQYWQYKVTFEYYHSPHELLKFVNSIEDLSSDSAILICAGGFCYQYYFYNTNIKGIAYIDPTGNKEEALNVLRNKLKIKYIYFDWRYDRTRILSDIIANNCDLVSRWENELYLYRIREKDLKKEELEKLFINDSLLKNGSFENWAGGLLKYPDFFQREGNTHEGSVTREEQEVKVGKYSVKITGDNFNFSQNLSNFEDYKGKNISCFVWVKAEVPNKYRIQIYDGVKSSFSKRHWGGGNWELLQASHKIDPSAEFVTIRVIQAANTGGVDDVVYVDGALLVEGYWNTFYQYELHMGKGR